MCGLVFRLLLWERFWGVMESVKGCCGCMTMFFFWYCRLTIIRDIKPERGIGNQNFAVEFLAPSALPCNV